MKRIVLSVAVTVIAMQSSVAWAHPGHVHTGSSDHSHALSLLNTPKPASVTLAQAQPAAAAPAATPGISGQGDLKFKVLYKGDHLPQEAIAVLKGAHGGFAVDRRPGKGQIYFALKGAGIIEISGDLSTTRMLPTAPEMKDTNLHNASIWYKADGTPYLVFPGNEAGKVFTTSIDGSLLDSLATPGTSVTFDVPAVNDYFKAGKNFVPTDVTELNGLYYVVTGYSDLDFVLTAKLSDAPAAAWTSHAFGGKGSNPGQFGTGHGVTITPDRKTVTVADRPNAEIDRFSPDGTYGDTVKLPEGSFPCDIDYTDGLAVVGCLHGPDRTKGAPIYLLKNDQIVSTIMPKEELGLENFTHVHNATMVNVGGKLYIIAQAWNPGDFAILEQVK